MLVFKRRSGPELTQLLACLSGVRCDVVRFVLSQSLFANVSRSNSRLPSMAALGIKVVSDSIEKWFSKVLAGIEGLNAH